MYFVQNHVYIQYGLNPTKIWHVCSVYYRAVPNSTKFCENIEIPQKWANSMSRLKIPCSAENRGHYWWVTGNRVFVQFVTVYNCDSVTLISSFIVIIIIIIIIIINLPLLWCTTDNGHTAGAPAWDGRSSRERETTESWAKTTHAHHWSVHSTRVSGL